MLRTRGFSLLEVMLALVVVAIGISVLLTFSASNQSETSNKAAGNDYSVIVNQVLEEFVNANKNCSATSSTQCTLLKNANGTQINEPVHTYLARAYTISSSQITALAATGITVKVRSCPSDVEHPNGCPS